MDISCYLSVTGLDFYKLVTSQQQKLAAESLYRDANSLLYADNKPSEDAIDRVIGKINREYVTYLDHDYKR